MSTLIWRSARSPSAGVRSQVARPLRFDQLTANGLGLRFSEQFGKERSDCGWEILGADWGDYSQKS